ncbi:hypothetical protein A0H81_10045 [Grifola frondosa]|uniref:PX domain-containing protein n=1 Tax=Grifola frondosa TaxID=5627 RepID=A0A1C7M5V2_GRIFR|nr:hypothetical protein A0H81_10045 [Grifola frondosa]
MNQQLPSEEAPRSPPTDYGHFVLVVLSRMTRMSGAIDQRVLRNCLKLSSSYLVTDITMSPDHGLRSWDTGFNRLVDVMVALHKRGELELETVSEASKACSECWSVAGSWREMDECKDGVKGVAMRLKGLLDENGKTYRGGPSSPRQDHQALRSSSSFPFPSSSPMERSPSLRPPRPSRTIPDLPTPLVTDTPPSPVSDDVQAFSTPLASPLRDPLTTSSEQAPEPPQPASSDPDLLTPVRAHYLKKELVHLQFQCEINALVTAPTNNISTFSYLGPPFTAPPKDAPHLDLPFLRYFFRRFVLSFPFLAAAPRDFFPDKLQPFLASFLSRNLSPTSVIDEPGQEDEEAARTRMLTKLERNMSMLFTSATKLLEKEEVVRLTQADLNRLETLAKKRAAREKKMKDKFDVNVICVRTVTEKKRMRSRVHETSSFRGGYGDFKTLAIELRKAHPSETVPPPPPKDRSFVNVAVSPSPSMTPLSSYLSGSNYPTSPLSSSSSATSSPPGVNFPSAPPVSPMASYVSRTPIKPRRPKGMPSMSSMYDSDRNSSADSFQTQSPISPPAGFGFTVNGNGGMVQQASRLAREKNRLTLRSYLHTLLSSSTFASSPVLRSFLLSGPTRLSEEEREDARRREEADWVREDARKRFAKEITARVDGLRDAVKSVKGELVGKDGLSHIFETIKTTENVRDLPPNYQAVIEWARISLASTVFQHFVASDGASESFASLKRIHGLMPYFMLKAALKISNPMGMIRGVLDLFLAQPFGGRSLMQRMFTGSLMEEVKALEEDIAAVKEKVEDPIMCEKVRLFVNAPREIQAVYKADAAAEDLHVIAAVLRSGEQPSLSRAQLQRVMYAHRVHKEYVKYTETLTDSDDDEGPQDEEAWLFEDLSVLAKLYSRLRDREQLIELIFEGTTADLLKDIITIFYAPLAQVYRAASIADSLGDLQNFMNDLIRTVEQTEELSQVDPARTVQIFIDLIQRHEQSFYSFVHKVHSKGEGLFTGLMRWIELFLSLMRDGLGERVGLEFLLPHAGQERADIMKEVDAVALYHYKLKVAYEDKIRRRFGRTQGMNDADAEDEAAAQLVNGVVKDLSFGELVQEDADDLAAQETDEDSNSSEGSSSGSSSSSSDEDDEEDEEDEEDDDSDSDGGGDSTNGSSTERDATPVDSPLVPPVRTPSRTLPDHHARQPVPNSPNSSNLSICPIIVHHRPRRDLGPSLFLHVSTHSLKSLPPLPGNKELPPTPSTHRRSSSEESTRRRGKDDSSAKKRKKAAAPKPPELEHIPKLLPLFVEMLSRS